MKLSNRLVSPFVWYGSVKFVSFPIFPKSKFPQSLSILFPTPYGGLHNGAGIIGQEQYKTVYAVFVLQPVRIKGKIFPELGFQNK